MHHRRLAVSPSLYFAPLSMNSPTQSKSQTNNPLLPKFTAAKVIHYIICMARSPHCIPLSISIAW
ncbi:hypothetical protein CCACVL1_12811, partial [Corchorus capsularis]